MSARNSTGFGVVGRAAAETAALRRLQNDLGNTPPTSPRVCTETGRSNLTHNESNVALSKRRDHFLGFLGGFILTIIIYHAATDSGSR
jgi:hypothetical protein